MKSKTVGLTLFVSIVWVITSSLLYFSAINRFYLFTPIDAAPIHVISNSDGKQYEVIMTSGTGYIVELYSAPSSQNIKEEPNEATVDRAIVFFNKHMSSLNRLPFWLRISNSLSPKPIVNIIFCYVVDPTRNGESALESAGFRVDWSWLGFSIFLLGPTLLLSLLVFIWTRIFPS